MGWIIAIFAGLFKAIGATALVLFAGIGVFASIDYYNQYIEKAGQLAARQAQSGVNDLDSEQSASGIMTHVSSSLVPESAYKNALSLSSTDVYKKAVFEQIPQGRPVSLFGEVVQIIKPNLALVATGIQVTSGNVLHATISGYSGQYVLIRFPDRPAYIFGEFGGVKGQYLGVARMNVSTEGVVDIPVIDVDYYWDSSNQSRLDDFLKSEGAGLAAR